MEIKEMQLESLNGKELRTKTARVKDDERYLVWIMRVDPNVTHSVYRSPSVGFKKK